MEQKYIERFHERYIPEPNTGCWLWVAGSHSFGHGVIRGPNNSTLLAHRVAYELAYGNFDKKFHVLHKCDVPQCVNPDHLFLGTHGDNMRDAAKKGRLNVCKGFGEKHPITNLTNEDINQIRIRASEKENKRLLALEFKVSHSQICRIVNRSSWSKV